MENFNPNDIAVVNGNFFGLPYSVKESNIVLLPVEWDATVSYGKGTSKGPKAILNASVQVDLYHEEIPNAWETKIGSLEANSEIESLNLLARERADNIISMLEKGESPLLDDLTFVNDASNRLNSWVEEQVTKQLDDGKIVGVIGGEHSVPFGAIKALSKRYSNFGILHIDAHADLREAYEGFKYSHASIMYNVLEQLQNVTKIVQVGVRDFCEQEHNIILNNPKVTSFTNRKLSAYKFNGTCWRDVVENIIAELPDKVYISFDIDGLSPELSPSTGTPVPGGLSYNEVDFMLELLAKSGKEIIGFDLCEVAPSNNGDEWDGNVGARVLFMLSQWVWFNRTL